MGWNGTFSHWRIRFAPLFHFAPFPAAVASSYWRNFCATRMRHIYRFICIYRWAEYIVTLPFTFTRALCNDKIFSLEWKLIIKKSVSQCYIRAERYFRESTVRQVSFLFFYVSYLHKYRYIYRLWTKLEVIIFHACLFVKIILSLLSRYRWYLA